MGLFDSIYLNRYKSLLQKINDLNEKNGKGYNTFKEYVLSDEVMMSYFRQLKELEKKYSKLHVDSFETFQRRIYEQLNDIYHKKLNEIIAIKDKGIYNQRITELKQNIEDSFGHCCDPQLNIILNDINKIIGSDTAQKDEKNDLSTKKNNINISKLKNIKKRKLEYFDEKYNEYIKYCDFNLKEAIESYNNNACINCGSVFDSQIKGNKKCPICKKKIYVRTDMFNKDKVEVCDSTLKSFEKYDKTIREILFCEKIMKNNQFVYKEYMSLFNSIKNKNTNVKSIMWEFINKVGMELDNLGYKYFMIASRKNVRDRALENFDAIRYLGLANQQYVALFNIANYEHKTNIALDTLTHVAYRDIQIVVLDKEGDCFRKFKTEDYTSQVHSAIIVEFLEKNGYTIDVFKKHFLETRHPFILPRLSNQESWGYIELSLKQQIEWNERK